MSTRGVGSGTLLFWRARATALRWRPRHVLAHVAFPALIFDETPLRAYRHTLTIQRLDPCTTAKRSPAVQQLLDFDKWPFVVQPQAGALGIPEPIARSFAEGCKPYLVRLSAQYTWNSQAVGSIALTSTLPIVLENASVLAGD